VSTLTHHFRSSFDGHFLWVVQHPAKDGAWLVKSLVRAGFLQYFSLLVIIEIIVGSLLGGHFYDDDGMSMPPVSAYLY